MICLKRFPYFVQEWNMKLNIKQRLSCRVIKLASTSTPPWAAAAGGGARGQQSAVSLSSSPLSLSSLSSSKFAFVLKFFLLYVFFLVCSCSKCGWQKWSLLCATEFDEFEFDFELFTEEEEDDGDIYILDGTIAIIFVSVGKREAKNWGFLLPTKRKNCEFCVMRVLWKKRKTKEKKNSKKRS